MAIFYRWAAFESSDVEYAVLLWDLPVTLALYSYVLSDISSCHGYLTKMISVFAFFVSIILQWCSPLSTTATLIVVGGCFLLVVSLFLLTSVARLSAAARPHLWIHRQLVDCARGIREAFRRVIVSPRDCEKNQRETELERGGSEMVESNKTV